MTGKQLKEIRAKLGLTQAALAHELDVDVMTISRYERGLRAIPTVTAKYLMMLLAQRQKPKRK